MSADEIKEIMKMLRAVVNGQSALKEELLGQINKLREETKGEFKKVRDEIRSNRERIDRLGSQLAYLEDDAPTREEFDSLEKRVEKVEEKVASA